LKKWAACGLLVLLALLAIGFISNASHLLPTPSSVRAASPLQTSVFLTTPSGSNHTDDLKGLLKTITFDVNVSAAPSIDAFKVILQYNTTMFSITKNQVDYSGGLFGPNANLIKFCIDNINQVNPGSSCLATDGDGVITLNMGTLGNQSTPALTNGLLFQVTFNILTAGLGQVHIFQAQLIAKTQTSGGQTTESNVSLYSTVDAYYTNIACPRLTLVACRPPSVMINVTPATPSQGSLVSFNVTVAEHNSNARVRSYFWDWGDGSVQQPQTNLTLLQTHRFDVNTIGLSGSNCVNQKACPVTLTVFDSESVNWKTTIIVHLVHLFIHLSIGAIDFDQQSSVIPGAQVHITAHIDNHSLIAENATLTIFLQQKQLNAANFSLAPPGTSGALTTGTLSTVWNTSNYSPRAYAVIVRIDKPISAQKIGGDFVRGENVTTDNLATNYVILVTPQILGSLSLSLIQTTGLGILILVAAVVGLTRLFRKPSYETEPL
jgi:hypothetical protein